MLGEVKGTCEFLVVSEEGFEPSWWMAGCLDRSGLGFSQRPFAELRDSLGRCRALGGLTCP